MILSAAISLPGKKFPGKRINWLETPSRATWPGLQGTERSASRGQLPLLPARLDQATPERLSRRLACHNPASRTRRVVTRMPLVLRDPAGRALGQGAAIQTHGSQGGGGDDNNAIASPVPPAKRGSVFVGVGLRSEAPPGRRVRLGWDPGSPTRGPLGSPLLVRPSRSRGRHGIVPRASLTGLPKDDNGARHPDSAVPRGGPSGTAGNHTGRSHA